MNYFIYKGINSKSFKTLVVQELPPITKPPVRYSQTEIDGKDGDVIEILGYKSYDKQISIGLKNLTEIDKIIQWLSGNGEIIFSNELDKFYNAQILEQIDFTRLLRFRIATIKVHIKPYKYSNSEGIETTDTTDETSITITNNGNVTSKPKITLTGTGIINITCNNKELKFTFDNNGQATFDSEKEDVSYANNLLNRNMIGEFIELLEGNNEITWTETITKWEVQNKSRWI